ncbi:MAG: hypothetical protein ACUVTD_01300 [Nitrososphaerales archaeon]
MADKWETARYLLNISKVIPDTEYRPMYIGIVKRACRHVFLYLEYVDFSHQIYIRWKTNIMA